jgi:Domain of unknown function (DUF4870)
MQTEEQNYGVIGEHGANPASMSTQEEKSWSVLAHLSLFQNIVTGFLGPVAALVIWLVYKDRPQKGGVPRAPVDVVPGGVARAARRRMGIHTAFDAGPDRLPPRAGNGSSDPGALRPRRLRGLQGEPGLAANWSGYPAVCETITIDKGVRQL